MDSPQRRIAESSERKDAPAESSARVGAAERARGWGGAAWAGAVGGPLDRAWELAQSAAQVVDEIVHRHPHAALAASVAVGAALGARRRGRRSAVVEAGAAPRPRSLARSVAGQAASLAATEALRIAAGLIADHRGGGELGERDDGDVALDQPERRRRAAAASAASAASATRIQPPGPGSRPPT